MQNPENFQFQRLLHQEMTVAEGYQSLVQKFNESSEINDLIVLSSAHKSNVHDLMKEFSVKPGTHLNRGGGELLCLPDHLSNPNLIRVLNVLVHEEKRLYQNYLNLIESKDITKRVKDSLRKPLLERVRENMASLEVLMETLIKQAPVEVK